MAATALTVNITSRSGINLTTLAASADGTNGNSWPNTGTQTLIVINGGGSTCTVTLIWGIGSTIDGQTPSERTVAVLAGDTAEIGPFPQTIYNDIHGNASVTYSQVSSVTVVVRQTGT
jgi:hypothetical protein